MHTRTVITFCINEFVISGSCESDCKVFIGVTDPLLSYIFVCMFPCEHINAFFITQFLFVS